MRRSCGKDHEIEATILFTDIVDSSRLAESLGDRPWLRVLLSHHRVVRSAVRRAGGRIVKSQGDGFMIVFSDAGLAFHCAVEIQRQLVVRSGEAPLSVRCGIHTGAVVREGRDFHGRSVIIAARLTQCAAGGEILASAEAVAAAGLERSLTTERESRSLKGLSGSFATYCIDWSEIEDVAVTPRRLPAWLRQIALTLSLR